jgi:uncharacterized protein (TIGR02145 family)
MKTKTRLIFLLFNAIIFFAALTACDKSDEQDDDEQNIETISDADGNVYHVVTIGLQVWTVENLQTTKYNDGASIPNVTDSTEWENLSTGAYCNYDNFESNTATYGRLYNWYAVNTGKLAPVGWHVPTDEDWTILENYLVANGHNYYDTSEGNTIAKSLAATYGWASDDFEGTPGNNPEENNKTGFNALPGGWRYPEGNFYGAGTQTIWWSSTESGKFVSLTSGGSNLFYTGNDEQRGWAFSVRLVKDY